MRQYYLIVMCVLLSVSTSYRLRYSTKNARRNLQQLSKYDLLVRCSRRYTPGLCLDPVIPVWTFVFQLQNCTERYGCPPDRRTNRFGTYTKCMRRCISLIELYTEILTSDQHNLSAYLRSHNIGSSGRREISDEEDIADLEKDDDVIQIQDIPIGPAETIINDDDQRDWAATVDIDNVDIENSQNDELGEEDPFHSNN